MNTLKWCRSFQQLCQFSLLAVASISFIKIKIHSFQFWNCQVFPTWIHYVSPKSKYTRWSYKQGFLIFRHSPITLSEQRSSLTVTCWKRLQCSPDRYILLKYLYYPKKKKNIGIRKIVLPENVNARKEDVSLTAVVSVTLLVVIRFYREISYSLILSFRFFIYYWLTVQ